MLARATFAKEPQLGAPAAQISGDMCEGDRGEMRRVSGTSHEVIEFVLTLDEAEKFIATVRGDDPELACDLKVVRFFFEFNPN